MIGFAVFVALFSPFLLEATEARKLSECATHPALSLPPGLTNDKATNGYHQWVTSANVTTTYSGVVFLPTKSDPCKGMAMHWDILNDTIKLGIVVEATGWAAFGISETGGMRGADVMYYESSSDELFDAFVSDGYVKPSVDDSQDWSLQSVIKTEDGFLIVEAIRALDTGDTLHDRKIVDDSGLYIADHIIIGAWGDDDEIFYHWTNRVSSSVQLFPGGDGMGTAYDEFKKDMEERAEGSVTLLLDGYKIPTDETTYYDLCFTNEDLVKEGFFKNSFASTYIIGYEFLIAEENVPYVHHITVNGHSSMYNPLDKCSQLKLPMIAWAPGADFAHFRDGGMQMGNVDNSFNAFTIEYHFDNPNGLKNLVDSGSGVILHYSTAPVEHDIGMFIVGDPTVALEGKPVGNGKSKHEFVCPSECTQSLMQDDEITFITESLHMHQVGRRMTNEVLRGEVMVNEAIIDYFDFDQRGVATVRQEPYILKKGDSIRTTCYYESQDDTEFGYGSREEMCMTFFHYYPKQPLLFACGPSSWWGACNAKYEGTNLEGESNFDREFEVAPDPSPYSPPTPIPNGSTMLSPLPRKAFIAMFGFLGFFTHAIIY